jgi:hypothetical protein
LPIFRSYWQYSQARVHGSSGLCEEQKVEWATKTGNVGFEGKNGPGSELSVLGSLSTELPEKFVVICLSFKTATKITC